MPSPLPPLRLLLGGALVDAGARVVWGHSPHHIPGTQCRPYGVALYSAGELIDDYAIDPTFRNDRQRVYLLELDADRGQRVLAFPVTLAGGRAQPADGEARRWIEVRLRDACRAVGSEVVAGAHGGLEIWAAAAGGAHGAGAAR